MESRMVDASARSGRLYRLVVQGMLSANGGGRVLEMCATEAYLAEAMAMYESLGCRRLGDRLLGWGGGTIEFKTFGSPKAPGGPGEAPDPLPDAQRSMAMHANVEALVREIERQQAPVGAAVTFKGAPVVFSGDSTTFPAYVSVDYGSVLRADAEAKAAEIVRQGGKAEVVDLADGGFELRTTFKARLDVPADPPSRP